MTVLCFPCLVTCSINFRVSNVSSNEMLEKRNAGRKNEGNGTKKTRKGEKLKKHYKPQILYRLMELTSLGSSCWIYLKEFLVHRLF